MDSNNSHGEGGKELRTLGRTIQVKLKTWVCLGTNLPGSAIFFNSMGYTMNGSVEVASRLFLEKVKRLPSTT